MGAYDDIMAVVDPNLKVYGMEGLRVADASIMPQVIRRASLILDIVKISRAATAKARP